MWDAGIISVILILTLTTQMVKAQAQDLQALYMKCKEHLVLMSEYRIRANLENSSIVNQQIDNKLSLMESDIVTALHCDQGNINNQLAKDPEVAIPLRESGLYP